MSTSGFSYRFHPNHADNVVLDEKRSVAYRTSGFGNGIVFSERYLYPGEFFVVEIEENEMHWQGYLRLGLTQVEPQNYSSDDPVCRQEMFNLRRLGSTWMFALTELALNFTSYPGTTWPYDIDVNKIAVSDKYIKTCWGTYARVHLNSPQDNASRFTNLEVGFKIGVVYVPSDTEFADLYYVLNGHVFGPYAIEIPYKQSPLFAVADVYGRTKKIRLLPLPSEQSLKQLCRITILETHDMEKLNTSALPKPIIDYLNFNSATSII